MFVLVQQVGAFGDQGFLALAQGLVFFAQALHFFKQGANTGFEFVQFLPVSGVRSLAHAPTIELALGVVNAPFSPRGDW